jgi:hypothetical protein
MTGSPDALADSAMGLPEPDASVDLDELAASQLTHALDARRRGLKVYESLESLNDVIGTQYGDRVLFELVQNAHDAHPAGEPGEIAIRLAIDAEDHGELLVANRGRPFTTSNLNAVRNIGTSDKQIGEGIGNKGLGFRSVEALTEDVHIYSAAGAARSDEFDGYCFRFARVEEIEAGLAALGASEDVARSVAANIPRYLVPVAAGEQSQAVRDLARDGYATVVALPLRSVGAVALARAQVQALIDAGAPVLLFLDRIAGLNVLLRSPGAPPTERHLTRRIEPLEAHALLGNVTLARVTLDDREAYLVARQTLPKPALLRAVGESLAAAPPLKRWLDWRGDAVVSVAVPLDGRDAGLGRLFNFLPMDERSVAPIAGHIDAPFFADIDRRSIKPDLPLNKHLLDAAASTAAAAALAIVDDRLDLPSAAVVDLAAWSGHHAQRIIAAFAALKRPLAKAAIWPTVSGDKSSRAGFDTLYAWPEAKTRQLTPGRLAEIAEVAIIPATLGEARLARVKAVATAVSQPLTPGEEEVCRWAEAVALALVSDRRRSRARWSDFFDDVVSLFIAGGTRLSALEGRKILVAADGKSLAATAKGVGNAPPVFVRVRTGRGRRGDGPPSPPSSLARRFRFLDESIVLGDATLRAFEKAGLLKRYDPLEILGGIKGALGATPTDLQRREALVWSFKVWRAGGGKSVEDALRAAGLFVPTIGGWSPIADAVASSSWTSLGRTLEAYLHDAAAASPDCARQRDRLLLSFADWPRASPDDRKDDWHRFLVLLGLVDGLRPIAGEVQAVGTPSWLWHSLFQNGKAAVGLDARWVARARGVTLENPQTDYHLKGAVWRLPGQIEHERLPPSAREALSELIVAYLREYGDTHFRFVVEHWRGSNRAELPTPLAVFLDEAAWVANVRRDEIVFARPRASWSTTAARQIPPRFTARFGAEPGSRAGLPAILFDRRLGLRDWSSPATAPERLTTLAAALDDLSAAERRDLRDQLRRAWSDVAESGTALPSSLSLVVERTVGLDVVAPDPAAKPVVHVTGERQGFAARALADRGEAVLDVGETDAEAICALLNAAGGFTARLADAGDVRLVVDGLDFVADPRDPLLVSGDLAWLAEAAVFAHEYIGDSLELRTLPPDELERRLRQVRVRRCTSFALIVDKHEVVASGSDRVQPVPHARAPTLVVGGGTLDLDLLIDAAPALTKLMGARRNTLEQMLGRLRREGFNGAAAGPTEEQYARAIRRDVSVVRDHLAATRGSVERLTRALLPVVAHLRSREEAAALEARLERAGGDFNLRDWLTEALGAELASRCLEVAGETDDQSVIRRAMGFDFAAYGQTLALLGYPPLNDEADFRRLFGAFMAELRPGLVDRVRRRFLGAWSNGGDLRDYVELRKLEFVTFNSTWPATVEVLDRDIVAQAASAAADAKLGPDDTSLTLPELEASAAANRKLIAGRHTSLANFVRAWCRKAAVEPPEIFRTGVEALQLTRTLDGAGLLDFAVLKPDDLPGLCDRVGVWPAGMPQSASPADLGLEQGDLDYEANEAREAKRRAEVDRRAVIFRGVKLDTGDAGFSHLFESLADSALAADDSWFGRSRPPRLLRQEQATPGSGGGGGGGGGGGQSWQNQPPEAIRRAMGIASEWLAREYLRRRHPAEMSDDCWKSSNRAAFCSGDEGNDSLGYDFRVETTRNEWLYEVKSALDEGGEFELSARELEVAGSASLERKRRYRILYVPFVFDPTRWRVLPLSNPVAGELRDRFKVVRTGSVRYRFQTR